MYGISLAWKFIAGVSSMLPGNRIGKIAWIAAAFLLVFLAAILPLRARTVARENDAVEKAMRRRGTAGRDAREGLLLPQALQLREPARGRSTTPEDDGGPPTLPLGTRVKVINLANDRSVVVTVNDRCRSHSFEFIDLSRAAARELGFFGRGMAQVRIVPMIEE